MRKYFTILLFIFTLSAIAQDKGNKTVTVAEFKTQIDTLGLTFKMPQGYTEAVVKDNKDLWYSFAIKNKTADFEIRYTIWSLKAAAQAYKKCQLDSSCTTINPNTFYEGRIQSNILNMTGGQQWKIDPFPPQAVKKEFNADDGGSSFFEFNCAFGKGYKYGQMVYLHKDNVADVIITYMSNDKTQHQQLMEIPFSALTFK